ncbi:uncharacterized protein VTP21DRAFT_10495 [Calcarisporiella thermophila]|uniref:uncharacterized protein n=1 Tax=Calcarisporiella thermophila TaxID=911321 RepID=UPI0037434065
MNKGKKKDKKPQADQQADANASAPKEELPEDVKDMAKDAAKSLLKETGRNEKKIQDLLAQLRLEAAIQQKRTKSVDHAFWNTQPVVKSAEERDAMGPIEPDVPHDQIRKDPYPLPASFEWCEIDINNDNEIQELYELLTNNYVEDDDAMFRFDYSAAFLKWALAPPGYRKSWHVGVRVSSNKKLVAFISGIPAALRTYEHKHHLTEINFLCVHKKLRNKRLAPVLIKEITRRSHLDNIFQAVYTAGVVIPTPIGTCRYYHRSINYKKLVEAGFSHLRPNQTMHRMLKYYRLPSETQLPGFRPLETRDIPQARVLLNNYLSKFHLAPIFETDAEFEHWFKPIDGVVWSYVVEDSSTKKITDLVSFYSLPSTVIGNPVHKAIHAAYCFYYAVNPPSSDDEKWLKTRLQSLMKDALVMAKNLGFDVFNGLDLLDNNLFIDELKFGPGDGFLNYYMYNWRCPEVKRNKVGLVML